MKYVILLGFGAPTLIAIIVSGEVLLPITLMCVFMGLFGVIHFILRKMV